MSHPLLAAPLALLLLGAGAAGPTLSLPGPITAEAQGPSGAAVSYSASATNPAGKALAVTCAPASGSTFSLGSTTVTCTVVDGDGSSASGTFSVTVVDTTPPAITAPPSVTVDAVGPTGAVATYSSPTATDLVDGSIPVACAPASGSTFAVGTTPVTCTASDSRGNTATATGSVTVVDRVPPAVTAPAPLTVGATSSGGIASSDGRVAAFLGAATASDNVTPAPQLTNDAPAVFPVGTTTVRFRATDGSGNTASATSTVTVTPPAGGTTPTAPNPTPPAPQPPGATPGATPAAPGAVDRTAPGEVTAVKARRAGAGTVSITWRLPPDADLANITILRSTAGDAAASPTALDAGKSTSFRDTKLRNGVLYRYVIVTVDRAGNRSRGVAFAITPRANLLWAPAEGARVVTRPLFVWAARSGAAYYNVQVFRGTTKVFSAWPSGTRLRMPASWSFGGKRQRLVPGTYRWYVWPGFGARAAARYGDALGTSTFTVAAR